MKKLILYSAFAITLFGCSPDDSGTENDTSNDCRCGVITYVNYVDLPSGETATTIKVRNNCSGQISTIGLSGHVGAIGEQYCGN